MDDRTGINQHRVPPVARRSTRELSRARLLDLLGDLPTESAPPSARLVNREERKHYTVDRLVLQLNGIEEVPAFFVSPYARGGATHPGRRPALLYFHSHGHHYDLGKRELTDGIEYMANPPYAEVCGQLGICALAIDQWGFGERHRETESELFKRFLWEGRLLWGMMIYDSLRALDYLASRDDVDSARIASIGMSMGSTLSWWTAALDERIALCVDLCCLTDYQSLMAEGGLDLHGLYYYVPRLLKYFTTSSINALIAPRPHLSLQGDNDALTPRAGIDAVDAELKRVYETEKAPTNWSLHRFPCGHQELPEMRKIVVDRLAAWAAS